MAPRIERVEEEEEGDRKVEGREGLRGGLEEGEEEEEERRHREECRREEEVEEEEGRGRMEGHRVGLR